MPVNEPDGFVVTIRQPNGRNLGDTVKAGRSGHPARMRLPRETRETLGFAKNGNRQQQVMDIAATGFGSITFLCNMESMAEILHHWASCGDLKISEEIQLLE